MSDFQLDSVEEVLEDIQAGKLVIVVDDEHRENEGDFVCAADHVTPESIAIMATQGRGLVCVTLDAERLVRLGLSKAPYLGDAENPLRTAFMDSVDSRRGITTGISAADRSHTVKVLIDPDSTHEDITKPGHLFPIAAHPEGVLGRPGHTEASVDLARMAGCTPAGVICEILKDNGEMARLPYLMEMAQANGWKICSVAAIIAHRQRHENIVAIQRSVQMPTDFGTFTLHNYYSKVDHEHHLALVMGDPASQEHPLVRLHSECLTGDVFRSQRCDCGAQLRVSMDMVAKEGHGVILYMRQEGRGIGLGAKLSAYALQDRGLDTVEANTHLGFDPDPREYSSSAQMLEDLKLNNLRLITNNPAKVRGLEQHGLIISERVPLVIPSNAHNERYIETKRQKMGHLL